MLAVVLFMCLFLIVLTIPSFIVSCVVAQWIWEKARVTEDAEL